MAHIRAHQQDQINPYMALQKQGQTTFTLQTTVTFQKTDLMITVGQSCEVLSP